MSSLEKEQTWKTDRDEKTRERNRERLLKKVKEIVETLPEESRDLLYDIKWLLPPNKPTIGVSDTFLVSFHPKNTVRVAYWVSNKNDPYRVFVSNYTDVNQLARDIISNVLLLGLHPEPTTISANSTNYF